MIMQYLGSYSWEKSAQIFEVMKSYFFFKKSTLIIIIYTQENIKLPKVFL